MRTPPNAPPASITRINPDGIFAAVLLSVLATAGFFYVSVMPALISGLITGLGFSPQLAGRVAACNIYGAAIGAFCAALVVRSVSWRRAAVLLLCALLALDLGSTLVREPLLLAAMRFMHGLTGGLLVGITYGVMSRTAFPDRCFGILMIVQSILGGIGSMFLPRLVPAFGAPVLFFAFAALSAAALIGLPFLPAYSVEQVGVSRIFDPLPGARSWHGLALALGAVFLFQTGNFAVNGYLIELGRANGFGLNFITATIGNAHWLATLGALLVVLIGTRWGRRTPIIAGTFVFLLGTLAFHWSAVPSVFVAACIGTAIAVFFVIPYLLGLCAEFDRGGRAAALAGLFSKLGIASGPLLTATLFAAGARSYVAVINAAFVCIAMSMVASVMSNRAGAESGNL
jgi:MFS transporter, DHA1 family, inner membrane transport protein